jgi:hypothetical protein
MRSFGPAAGFSLGTLFLCGFCGVFLYIVNLGVNYVSQVIEFLFMMLGIIGGVDVALPFLKDKQPDKINTIRLVSLIAILGCLFGGALVVATPLGLFLLGGALIVFCFGGFVAFYLVLVIKSFKS